MNPSFLFLKDDMLLSLSNVVSIPSMKIFPVVGLSSRPIMLSRVDFPDPELPTIKTNWPFLIENETSCNAFTLFSPSP